MKINEDFQTRKSDFMSRMNNVTGIIDDICAEFNIKDQDTLFNLWRDSKVGELLNYNIPNFFKHECDVMDDCGHILESKASALYVSSATFNDTSISKALSFKDKNVMISLSLWPSFGKLLCVAAGYNELVSDFLLKKVNNHLEKRTSRSTQSLSFLNLVFDYNFKIVAGDFYSKSEVLDKLIERFRRTRKYKSQLFNLTESDIMNSKEWTEYKNEFYSISNIK